MEAEVEEKANQLRIQNYYKHKNGKAEYDIVLQVGDLS
jgi:hypothetical protein